MQKALRQAEIAFTLNEVPIGAVIVSENGKIIGYGHNLVEKKRTQAAHAEFLAVQKATKKLNSWRLSGATLYVTLEPCSMCMNLILLSKIKFVVFAVKSRLFGFSIDKYNTFDLYKTAILTKNGICEKESLNLLKLFFKTKRKNKSE